MLRGVFTAGIAGAIAISPVQAGCWRAEEASAASVRELQSMLMVAALRCQVSGYPMMGDYNQFVTANRGAITAMNDRIKAHFIHAFGPVGGQRAYDSFTTSMANGYGAAASGADECGAADSLAREAAAMAGSVEGLMLLAERQGIAAKLPEGLCEGVAPANYAAAGSMSETARH